MRDLKESLLEEFWSKVNILSENECWEWKGRKDIHGYGEFYTGRTARRNERVHRIVYELFYNHDPYGFLVCHHCDNPPCCNPKHLFLGTHKDNAQDRNAKGRAASKKGHFNGRAKLNEGQVLQIRDLAQLRMRRKAIAQKFRISVSLVEKIIERKEWKHI